MAVDPTRHDLKTFLADDPGGPVVMLNLLRFKGAGGRESYARYSRALVDDGHLARVGGELLYAGDGSTALVAEDGQAWDAVLVVRYPSLPVSRVLLAHGGRPGLPEGHAFPDRGARGGGAPGHHPVEPRMTARS